MGNVVLHLLQDSHCVFPELQPLFSSYPPDPAGPGTVTDIGGVSRGSAGAGGAVIALGISLPADQQLVLTQVSDISAHASCPLGSMHRQQQLPSAVTPQLLSSSCQCSPKPGTCELK